MPNKIPAAADRAIFLPESNGFELVRVLDELLGLSEYIFVCLIAVFVMEMKDDEGCGFDRWLSNGVAAAENDLIGSVNDVIGGGKW
nr:hypothetical protein [Tanacetum cinerariifolium]